MFCMEYLEANFDWLEEKLSHVEKGEHTLAPVRDNSF